MKVLRYSSEADDNPRIGVVSDETITDVSATVDSFGDALERLTDGDLSPDGPEVDRPSIELLPATTPGNNVFAIALNYGSHIAEKSESDAIDAEERGIPATPYFFVKLYRSLVGGDRPISLYGDITRQLDYAAELAVVIGKPARNVDAEAARDYVAGYTILNDTAAYDIQNVSVGEMTWIDWLSAKSMENTTPLGPHVVGADDVDDPHDLAITSEVNGKTMQDGSTAAMIRGVWEQVAFLSSRFTLQPGDVIATGTPEGVGAFQDLALADGDRIDIEIEGVGRLSNTVESVDA